MLGSVQRCSWAGCWPQDIPGPVLKDCLESLEVGLQESDLGISVDGFRLSDLRFEVLGGLGFRV